MPVQGQIQRGQPLPVGPEILARGGQDDRFFLQQGQVVGDVAGGAAEALGEAVHHETDIEDVDLLRQDMIRKTPGKIHDPVIGQGPGNKNLHENL